MTARVLLLGASGLLGSAIAQVFPSKKIEVVPVTRREFDAEKDSVDSLESFGNFTHLLNCIAFHKVDQCETDFGRALDINCRFVRDLSSFCCTKGAVLIHISTDYIFDGRNEVPHAESDPPGPVNSYGVSKLAGEIAMRAYAEKYLIFRVSSLFGPCATPGHPLNFVEKILAQSQRGEALRVIDDQIMSPTLSLDAAEGIASVILSSSHLNKTFHCCNSGSCSWYEFASEAIKLAGMNAKIERVSYKDFHSPVKRPQFCSLNNDRINGIHPMRHWKEALGGYVQELAGKITTDG